MLNLIFAIASLVVSYVISASMQPKVEAPKPNSLDDFDFPQIEEGTPQGVVFGDVWVKGWTVLWFGNLRTTKVTSESGGKK